MLGVWIADSCMLGVMADSVIECWVYGLLDIWCMDG